MKSFLQVIILFLSFCISAISAQGNMYTEVAHYGQYFYDIDATDTDVTAAGDNIILNSSNEGLDWQEIKLPTNKASIKHVAKIAEQHYLAAGNAIYITKNDGKDWTIQDEMDDVIAMQNFGSTIIITREQSEKRFMRSDDSGETWVTLSDANASNPSTLDYIDKDNGYFSDSTGNIYFSFNGGLSWDIVNQTHFNEPIESLRFSTVVKGYAQIGDLVWETVDGGLTWEVIIDSFKAGKGLYALPSGLYTSSGSNFSYYGETGLPYIQNDPDIDHIFSFDVAEGNGKLYLSGSGMILRNDLNETFDTWTDLSPGPNDGFNIMAKRGDKFLISGGRRMLVSSDNRLTYANEETNISQTKDIAISPSGTIYNTQSSLQKSENDGKEWEFLKSGVSLIHVFGNGRLLIVGGNQISQSNDEGGTFEALFETPSALAHDLYFFDEKFGWFLNASGTSYRTIDGGITWEAINFPFGSSPSKMHFIDSENGFAIKRFTDKFWKTSDGGSTWEEVDFTGGEADLLDVYFEDEMIGYVVGRENIFTEGIVFKTINGGETWEVFQKGINLFYEVMEDEATGKVFVCGERGQVFSYSACEDLIPTLTSSESKIICNEISEFYKWYLNGTFLVETVEPFIDCIQDGIYSVRIVGENQCISNYSEGLETTVGTDDLIESKLVEVFPNPTSGIINLNLDPSANLVSTIVYDLSGKQVHKESSSSKTLHLNHLPSGSYFIRVQLKEGYDVKRIILR